jgi:SagB-type dehydrogenase family enzyme
MTTPGNLKTVFEYHDRTKHHLERYARSLGYMDWDTQPDPFRRYEGAPLRRLEVPADEPGSTYDSLFAAPLSAAPLIRESLSRLFYYSLSLSAWKQVRGLGGKVTTRWSLRVDPSSGNLHPTEGYLLCGPVEGLAEKPAVYHYAPHEHGLELRRELDEIPGLPAGSALIGITSIHWREAWKYGERAFRYCQHDCGHVIAALTLAAACLGWRAKLIDSIGTEQLRRMLGVDTQKGPEAEHADCLLLLSPAPANYEPAEMPGSAWQGTPNQLSSNHHPWHAIDDVSAAAESFGNPGAAADPPAAPEAPERNLPAHRLIRQRRSAMSMDGETSISRDAFYQMLARLMPQPVPYGALAWQPAVSLLLFVNRVDEFDEGLYILVRDPAHEASLRDALRDEFLWAKPATCPDHLPLYLLVPSDVKDAARTVSCHQDIAAEGVFAMGMLARFDETLQAAGPAMYPRLFWETGVIGQVLYLEAEAAGIRGTGIGCFFDDAVHRTIGIEDHSWQSLYHFTVGGPVDDPRLETEAAYNHL